MHIHKGCLLKLEHELEFTTQGSPPQTQASSKGKPNGGKKTNLPTMWNPKVHPLC